MAGWGLMMGVGQGLQQVGGMMLDQHKAKMKEQLEAERLARQEAREDMKFDRDQMSFDQKRNELRDGAWYEVSYNKAGREMDAVLAPQSTVQAMARAEEKEKLSLEKLMAETNKLEAESEFLPQMRAADLEYRRALTGQANRAYTGAGGGGGGGRSGGSATSRALTEASIDAYFTDRNEKGHKIRDGEKLREFMASTEYAEFPDKNEAAAAWINNNEAEANTKREELREAGAPEYALETILEGRNPKVPTRESLKPADQQGYDKIAARLARAKEAIEAGQTTPEEVIAKFEAEGFPRLALQLKRTYGID